MTSDAGSEPTDFLLTEAEERAVRENAALVSALAKLGVGSYQPIRPGQSRRVSAVRGQPTPPRFSPETGEDAPPEADAAMWKALSPEEKLLAAIFGDSRPTQKMRDETPTAGTAPRARPSARQRIDALTERRPAPDSLLDVSQAAAELEVSRQTVYNWLQTGKLLGWRKTKARRYIPAEQILGPGHVVPGLEDVLAEIEDPEIVWAFLTQDWPFEETTARPIALLKAGRVAEVVDAAKGYGASAT